MKVAVVSSVYGGYDVPVAPVAQITPAEFVLVTDREQAVEGWKVVVEPRPQLHPRLAAKVAKCRPDKYADADVYVWLDASARIVNPAGIALMVAQLKGEPLAQFRHHAKHTIDTEWRAASQMEKYKGLPLMGQALSYLAEGFPSERVLWETGCIVYHGDTPARIGDEWLAEQVRWTYEDQISEAPVLWRHGLQPKDLGTGHVYHNEFFEIRSHRSNL